MRILILGAGGFIGSHLASALTEAGHQVFPVTGMDLSKAPTVEEWLPRLSGADAVINAAGIIREGKWGSFRAVHQDGPIRLFDACVRAGVRTVVQISALGADEEAASRFHLTKKAADDHLASLDLGWVIIQPSVVVGPGGDSWALFKQLAALPLLPVLGRGDQRIQPIHVDDLTAGVVALLGADGPRRVRLQAPGAEPMTLPELLQAVRSWLGLKPARRLSIPMWAVRAMARVSDTVGLGPLTPESLQMLERGNVADPAPFAAATGVVPRSMKEAFPAADPASPASRRGVRGELLQARLGLLRPLLRISVGFIWLVTGIVSLGVYPVSESYALLEQVGVTGALAPLILFPTAAFEVLLGLATLAGYRIKLLGMVQLALVAGFTVIITVFLPEYWLHPFGPLTKNVPIIAAILLMMALEDARS